MSTNAKTEQNYFEGVGKTSLTANLAAELAFRGKKILLVDLDAQASLTFSLITPDEWVKDYASTKTIKSWFDSFEQGKPLPLKSIHPAASKCKRGCEVSDFLPLALCLCFVLFEFFVVSSRVTGFVTSVTGFVTPESK